MENILSQSKSNKRSNYHGHHRHHVQYHPYYSSSPLMSSSTTTAATTAAVAAIQSSVSVNSSCLSSIGSLSPNLKQQQQATTANYEIFGIHRQQMINISNTIGGLNSTAVKYDTLNLRYKQQQQQLDDLSSDSSVTSDENELSLLSTKTNPPTTPVSTSSDNTPSGMKSTNSSTSSPASITSRLRKQDIRSNNQAYQPTSTASSTSTSQYDGYSSGDFDSKLKSNKSIHHVTPATTNTNSSTSSSSSCYSSSGAMATYSRSSSMTSLNSFDSRSIYSSVSSEYSSAENQPCKRGLYSTLTQDDQGYMTPCSYSDIPDSPGELIPVSQLNRDTSINILSQRPCQTNPSSLNNSYLNKQSGLNEISVLTVDSNPSKSNDITMVERTVLANNSYTKQICSNSGNAAASGGTTLNNIEELNDEPFAASDRQLQQQQQQQSFSLDLNDEDERAIAYDIEGSLYDAASTRSNVSSLTFPNEPTADLEFIRNLLAKRSTPLLIKSDNSNEDFLTSLVKPQNGDQIDMKKQQEPTIATTRQWSTYKYTPIVSSSFTPPVKLRPEDDNVSFKPKQIYNDDGEEDEDDCARSIASIPSDIVRDNTTKIDLDKSNFSALFNKLSNKMEQSPQSTPNTTTKRQLFEFKLNQPNVVLNSSPANWRSYSNSNKLIDQTDNINNQSPFANKAYEPNLSLSFNNECGDIDDKSDDIHNSIDYSDKFNRTAISLENSSSNLVDTQLEQGEYDNNNNDDDDDVDESSKLDDDSDEKILNEFIDEMLPTVLSNGSDGAGCGGGGDTSDEPENNSFELDEDQQRQQLIQYQMRQQQQNLRAQMGSESVLSRILPKIDEVENENDDSKLDESCLKEALASTVKSTRRGSFGKSNPHSNFIPNSKQPIVQMNKTTRLRNSKQTQSKTSQQQTNRDSGTTNQVHLATAKRSVDQHNQTKQINQKDKKPFTTSTNLKVATATTTATTTNGTQKPTITNPTKRTTLMTSCSSTRLNKMTTRQFIAKSNLNEKIN